MQPMSTATGGNIAQAVWCDGGALVVWWWSPGGCVVVPWWCGGGALVVWWWTQYRAQLWLPVQVTEVIVTSTGHRNHDDQYRSQKS